MKNLLLSLFLLLTVGIFFGSCRSGYKTENDKVYYISWSGADFKKITTLMPDADAATFTTIRNNTNLDLGKDKNHVFVERKVLQYADPITFQQVKEYYWRDENSVYLIQFRHKDARIPDADPKTFSVLDKEYNWAKDQHNAYYSTSKLELNNPVLLEAINEDWARNDSFYFYHQHKLPFLDYATAKILSSNYIKDKYRVFSENLEVVGADPNTFVADKLGSYGHDAKHNFEFEKMVSK